MLNWANEGCTSFLNPKTPNVDLWRKIRCEVGRRGGLRQGGDDHLWFRWQLAHQRAHKNDTTEQRQMRRGKDFNGCDHDFKPKNFGKTGNTVEQDVKVPKEARILRRMPWAGGSLGTVEYLDDIWLQNDTSCSSWETDSVVMTANRVRPNVSSQGELRARAYLNKFSSMCSRSTSHVGDRSAHDA